MNETKAQKVIGEALRVEGFMLTDGGHRRQEIIHPDIGEGKVSVSLRITEVRSTGYRGEGLGRCIAEVGGERIHEKKGAFDLPRIVNAARNELAEAHKRRLCMDRQEALADALEREFGSAIATRSPWSYDGPRKRVRLSALESGKVRLEINRFEGSIEEVRDILALLQTHIPMLVERAPAEEAAP